MFSQGVKRMRPVFRFSLHDEKQYNERVIKPPLTEEFFETSKLSHQNLTKGVNKLANEGACVIIIVMKFDST